jgi:hypothetical protein
MRLIFHARGYFFSRFSRCRQRDVLEELVRDQHPQAVALREPRSQPLAVLVGAPRKIIRHADIQRPIPPIGHHGDGRHG